MRWGKLSPPSAIEPPCHTWCYLSSFIKPHVTSHLKWHFQDYCILNGFHKNRFQTEPSTLIWYCCCFSGEKKYLKLHVKATEIFMYFFLKQQYLTQMHIQCERYIRKNYLLWHFILLVLLKGTKYQLIKMVKYIYSCCILETKYANNKGASFCLSPKTKIKRRYIWKIHQWLSARLQ